MIERVAHEILTFPEPFFVEGLDREQEAGTYKVEIVEESLEGLSFLAYHVVSTSIALPLADGGQHSYQLVRINSDLVRQTMPKAADGSPQRLQYTERRD